MRGLVIGAAAALVAACSSSDAATSKAGGKIQLTVSGEALAFTGYTFPAELDQPTFVDGWELAFDEVLVTVDAITLSEGPDKSPTDQAQTDAVVAELDGPWAVDLHARGDLAGKGGGGETSVKLGELATKNVAGGGAFDPERRYAFGFSVVAATAAAKQVNLGAAAQTDYAEMIQKGYSTLFVGTATFKGGTSCKASDAAYDFSKLPTTVNFRFGFKTPAAYANCQNPDNDPAEAFAGEEHQRGVLVRPNQATIAQLTLHTDHLFWDAFQHDSPLHFDMIAAHYVGAAGTPTATLEDFAGVPFAPVKDATGASVPWRSCVDERDFSPPPGSMTFDTKGLDAADLAAFLSANESTMGHLDADGLCFVTRR